jgi:hypothetical protein
MFNGAHSPRLTLAHVLTAGLIVQLLSAVSLWQHDSTSTDVLGRFSSRYAIVLLFHGMALLFWLIAIWQRGRVERLLRHIPERGRLGLIAAGGAATAIIWFTSAENIVKGYVGVTWLCIAFAIISSLADQPVRWRRWPGVLAVILLLMLFLMYVSVLADRRFEPDEAAWADRSEAIFSAGGLYTRTYYWPPAVITPGYGWLHAGYGWLLHHFGLDIGIGRTWQFISYLIAFAGIGAAAARLYGRCVALAAAAVAVLSQAFVPILEYRGNLQIPAIATWIVFAALQARHVRHSAAIWHFISGLLAALSLQVHASGIIYVFALALMYSAEWAWHSYHQRRPASILPLLALGTGMLLGAAIFFVFNMMTYGGPALYLQRLQSDRGTFSEFLPAVQRLLAWPSMIEGALVLFGLVYIVWRRSPADKWLLGLLACLCIGALLLDTQGYLHTFSPFLVIPVGVLLVQGFASAGIASGQNRRSLLVTGATVFALALQMYGLFLWNPAIWNWFRTGQMPPFLYKEIVPVLEPYIREDDTVVSTHQLFWGFPHLNLVSHIVGGVYSNSNWVLKNGPFASEVDLWEDVNPSLIIYIEQEMHFDPGLQEYMNRHQFRICDELRFMERDIRLYRTDCSGS